MMDLASHYLLLYFLSEQYSLSLLSHFASKFYCVFATVLHMFQAHAVFDDIQEITTDVDLMQVCCTFTV